MAWTEAQERAIEARGRNLLVAAAAGSGKTAVLVQRIIGLVLSGACDVDELLVVTFTHAAAEEMRGRLESALTKAVEETNDKLQLERLERQLVLLSGASIQTIDSFCQSILRQRFADLDLDPKFRVANEQELRLIQRDVLEELFERKYGEGSDSFLEFTDAYGGSERGDESLYQLVLELYKFSQSQPFPIEWLNGLSENFNIEQGKGLSDTHWYNIILMEIRLAIEKALGENDEAQEQALAMGADFYMDNLKDDRAILSSMEESLEDGSWQNIYDTFRNKSFGKLKSAPKGTPDEVKEPIKALRDSYKKSIQALTEKYFMESEEEMLDDLRAAAPVLSELTGVTAEFLRDYAAAKHEKSIVDFSDLEHFTLDILSSRGQRDAEGRLIPSDTAVELQDRYKTVMVDEYQDTNGVQESILQLIASPEKGNLFAVGDVKQSIYRFRLADPSLFLKKYHEYPHLGELYEKIDLSKNFRSRKGILSAINFIFAQVMVKGTMELSYDEDAMLYPGPDYPACSVKSDLNSNNCLEPSTLEGPVELALIVDEEDDDSQRSVSDEVSSDEQTDDEDDLKGAALEAQFIANRLKEIRGKGTMVFDSVTKNYRPFQWRDAVILLRSVRSVANEMLEVLRKNDIPAYASVDGGYFEAQEIRIMLALLSILDNARQDIKLAAVLLSPIGGMTPEDLAKIRLVEPEDDLYTALIKSGSLESGLDRELAERVVAFTDKLSHWRNISRELSVPELVWQLYRDTGYYDYVGGLSGGLLKQANLRMLVDRAAAFEKTDFRGLFRFLRFVERMREMDTDLAAARTLGESENVVRIMSIHKSKGLEFPLVFVASLGKKFNLSDAVRPMVLMHRELGLGPYRVELEGPVEYPTFARNAVAQKIRQESKAEEMRVLYVALTRAREKLILVGSAGKADKFSKRAERWCRYTESTVCALPEYAVMEANSFLDWIGMAVSRHPSGEVLIDSAETPRKRGNISDYKDDSNWSISIVPGSAIEKCLVSNQSDDTILQSVKERKPLPEGRFRTKVETLLRWEYDKLGLEGIPAKMSVTELKRRMSERREDSAPMFPIWEEITFRQPNFGGKGKSLSPSEYGTLMHSVMQNIDINGALGEDELREQINGMAEREILQEEFIPLIRISDIARFFSSPLGKRMLKAREVYRELPFSRMLPARSISTGVKSDDEQVFIQGIIDVLFRDEDGGLILLDYKTDRDTNHKRAADRHRKQIEVYAEAVEDILGEPVAECYLCMLQDGSVIPLKK